MICINCENIAKFVEIINELVEESILHGGDPGGPYYCNEENVIEQLNKLIEYCGLTEYKIESGDIPKIIKCAEVKQ